MVLFEVGFAAPNETHVFVVGELELGPLLCLPVCGLPVVDEPARHSVVLLAEAARKSVFLWLARISPALLLDFFV